MNDALCQNILPEEIIQLDKSNNTGRSEAFNLQSFKPPDLCGYTRLLLLGVFTQSLHLFYLHLSFFHFFLSLPSTKAHTQEYNGYNGYLDEEKSHGIYFYTGSPPFKDFHLFVEANISTHHLLSTDTESKVVQMWTPGNVCSSLSSLRDICESVVVHWTWWIRTVAALLIHTHSIRHLHMRPCNSVVLKQVMCRNDICVMWSLQLNATAHLNSSCLNWHSAGVNSHSPDANIIPVSSWSLSLIHYSMGW